MPFGQEIKRMAAEEAARRAAEQVAFVG